MTIAVTSRSFSKNEFLRKKLLEVDSNVKFNDSNSTLKDDELVNFLKGCDKAITSMEIIDEKLLSKLPALKKISKFGVGIDMIDTIALKKKGIKLNYFPGTNKRSVSELVISLSTLLLRKAPIMNADMKEGKWKQIKGRQLSGLTVGIIGCGPIGRDVIHLIQPYQCKLLLFDQINLEELCNNYKNVRQTTLENLLTQSDVITIHLPLNEKTKNIINSDMVKLIKKNAVLINLARGGLIDEDEVIQSLKDGLISGVAIDCFRDEPLSNFQISKIPNLFTTPHIGGSTEEAILSMGMAAIEGIID